MEGNHASSWVRQLPGFRSRRLWKQILATGIYLLLGLTLFTGILYRQTFTIVLVVGLLGLILLAANSWGLRARLPLLGSNRWAVAMVGWVAVGLVYVVGLAVASPTSAYLARVNSSPQALSLAHSARSTPSNSGTAPSGKSSQISLNTPTPSATPASTPSSTPTPEVTASATPTSTSVPTPSPTVASAAAAIIGFGATDTAWNAHHVQAAANSGLAPGCCYDPDPTLPQNNGHVGYKYVTVGHQNGRVLNYQMDLHPSTSIGEAKASALQEFPTDATVLWFATRDTCAQMEVQSATLGKALGTPAIGDPEGMVYVELYTVKPDGNAIYDPANINEGLVMLASFPKASDGPAC